MQLEKIAKSEQANMIGAFWALMRQAEEDARESNSALDKYMVEGYYALWNRVTGDNKVPFWLQEANKKIG